MTKREQLQERYEDALFALMMDTLDRIEGCSALELNERLPKEIPPDIEKKCLGIIFSYFKKSQANTVRRKTFKIILNSNINKHNRVPIYAKIFQYSTINL